MELKWTHKALSDLARLYEFLVPVNRSAAARTQQALTKAPAVLMADPSVGEQLYQFGPLEIRRLMVGQYEMRCEIEGQTVYVLRLWHTR